MAKGRAAGARLYPSTPARAPDSTAMLTKTGTAGFRPDGGAGMLSVCLKRTYYPDGTNSVFLLYGQPVCHAIELPWRSNRRSVSCIPEGRYRLQPYKSRRFGSFLMVADVPGRSGILIHAANNAAAELQGCIAPVTRHTG